MTSLRAVERRYNVLTPDERFRLSAAARARGDKAEERRLDDACPRVNLTGLDLAFSGRWLALCEVAEGVARVLLVLRERDLRADALRDVWLLIGRISLRSAEWGWHAGWDARGGAPMSEFDPLAPGAWWDDADVERWGAIVAAAEAEREPAQYLVELAVLWRAWCEWSLETVGTAGAPLFAGLFGGDALGLADWATKAADRAGEPDSGMVAEARAAFDDMWRRRVTDRG